MNKPQTEAFSVYLDQTTGLLNAMDAFAAGWNAACEYLLKELVKLEKSPDIKRAPAEEATPTSAAL